MSTISPSKFGNWLVSSSHIFDWMELLTHVGIEVNPCYWKTKRKSMRKTTLIALDLQTTFPAFGLWAHYLVP